jgi:polyferredoxin
MRQKIRKIVFFTSLLVFPLTLNWFSPFLVMAAGFQGIVAGSLLLFCSLFITSLVFGRMFCSWICPGGSIQDRVAETRTRRYGGRKVDAIKYFIWIPWIGMIIWGFISAGGIGEIQLLFMMENGISVSQAGNWYTFFLVVFVFFILALIFGKRAACHSICWMSPFMILSRKLRNALKFPAYQLNAFPDSCSKCGTCTKNCPMSLPVTSMVEEQKMENVECILCANCVDNCSRKAIVLKFQYP